MNSPMPSLLLPLWQNESLSETICVKIYVTCTVIRMKIKYFHGKRLVQALVLQIEAQTVEVKVYICAKRPIRPALIKNNLTKKQFTIVVCLQCPIKSFRYQEGRTGKSLARFTNLKYRGSRFTDKKISFSRITKIRK